MYADQTLLQVLSGRSVRNFRWKI